MKSPDILEREAKSEIESEKEQTIKEVIKELLLDIQKTEEEIKDAQQRLKDMKKKYDETMLDNNLLMKLCLKKVVTQPIKKD
jgi:DNA anti-recombination protein RmuC